MHFARANRGGCVASKWIVDRKSTGGISGRPTWPGPGTLLLFAHVMEDFGLRSTRVVVTVLFAVRTGLRHRGKSEERDRDCCSAGGSSIRSGSAQISGPTMPAVRSRRQVRLHRLWHAWCRRQTLLRLGQRAGAEGTSDKNSPNKKYQKQSPQFLER